MMRLPRVGFALVFTVAGISCGGTDPSYDRSPILPGPSPLPDNVPQQTVSGFVHNTAFEAVAGAQVAIVGTSLSTVTDAAGVFDLRGNIDSPLTVQVAKDGYVPQSRATTLQPCAANPDPCRHSHVSFILNTVAPAHDITGEYSLSIVADPTCADLPADARERTFTASITSVSPDNTSLEMRIGGASLYVWGSNVYYAGVAGDRFSLRLDGSWLDQAFMDEVAPNTYVGYSGWAAATVLPAAATFSAVLDGSITSCRTRVPLNEPSYGCEKSVAGQPPIRPETFVACYAKNHRMVFTRR